MKRLLIIAALTGLSSVALGAAGDHLAATVQLPHAFETALRYNQLYSLLLTALALFGLHAAAPLPRLFSAACWAFTVGTLVFCASLYALALTGIAGLGYITPFGGLTLMAGWLLLAAYGWSARKSS